MRSLVRTVAVLPLAAALHLSTAAAGDAASPNYCRLTSQGVSLGCQSDARADYQVAVANCLNRPDTLARKACRSAAAVATKEAQEECRDQLEARQDACDELGPTPYAPLITPANFVATIDNPYFPLTPGTTYIYEGQIDGAFERVEFSVTHRTKVILGVTCVEVHDVATIDGERAEDTVDWFAQDVDGNVWYFGENTFELEDGLISSIDGAWLGGIDEAKPGIVMPAHPAVGDFYRQEFSLANAEDLAEVLSLGASVSVPFGTFSPCLQTEETTPLSPDHREHKFYAPGIGNVLTIDPETGERSELKQIITE